ncbi:PREDICTED: myosin heavy chain, clone 203 [Ceratosolen solmsi marchali]|uniref:Myosin heavy chain, clone 203 n=1 Tax=Ceratosolen solmsi marchali TaxID=326594 RepID=A0AAJ6YSV0_9HYME|nr:PREDICTED: myosin heavy chain, clone 203 [Ceratosolen solmsi marchali]
MDTNGQLLVKYQKLATEYSKIRAQVNVLKKAVIDEQTHNTELKEQLKEKEVELRRAEQELDSLSFRNQQLTKRVTVLQEDLDKIQTKTKKGKSKGIENKFDQFSSTSNDILDEEFQKKIVENALLLSQISDKNSEIESLLDKKQHLEYKLELSEKAYIDLDSKYSEIIEKFESEQNNTQRKLDENIKQEKTISCSSENGKTSNYGLELKSGVSNYRQDLSTFSLSSASRRSSKSIMEIGPLTKIWRTAPDEFCDNFTFTKLTELEKELNHWKAEYNIIKIKFDELNQKENIEKNLFEINSLEPIEVNNMIGTFSGPFSLSEEIIARETKIKEYFLHEINRLIMEKQIYHVRNLAIAANIEVINAHLNRSEEKREICEATLLEALSSSKSLQEDKEIQEGNYKSQLSTMSEHLANMNEKLIYQTEEIQQLKFELSTKVIVAKKENNLIQLPFYINDINTLVT